MTELPRLTVTARSFAEDAAYRATAALAQASDGIDWRLIGGMAVHLQVRRSATTDIDDRTTQDADGALRTTLAADRTIEVVTREATQVADRLHAAGYVREAGNRFVLPSSDSADPAIDLVGISTTGRVRSNRPIRGTDLVVDEFPGVGFAFGPAPHQQPDIVLLRTILLDGTHHEVTVPIANVMSLLILKADCLKSRSLDSDAVDIWRLLEVVESGDASVLRPWPGDTLRILRQRATQVARTAAQGHAQPDLAQARVMALLARHVLAG